jgi:hypothetical protein
MKSYKKHVPFAQPLIPGFFVADVSNHEAIQSNRSAISEIALGISRGTREIWHEIPSLFFRLVRSACIKYSARLHLSNLLNK